MTQEPGRRYPEETNGVALELKLAVLLIIVAALIPIGWVLYLLWEIRGF